MLGQSSDVFRNLRNVTLKHCRSVRRNKRKKESERLKEMKKEGGKARGDRWGE